MARMMYRLLRITVCSERELEATAVRPIFLYVFLSYLFASGHGLRQKPTEHQLSRSEREHILFMTPITLLILST